MSNLVLPDMINPIPPAPPLVQKPLSFSTQILQQAAKEPHKAALAIILATSLACTAFTDRGEIISVLKKATKAIDWTYNKSSYLLTVLTVGSLMTGFGIGVRSSSSSPHPVRKSRIDLTDPTRDLALKSARGELPQMADRKEIVNQLFSALLCAEKPNAVLVGPPGVGKTAIVENLAAKLATTPPDQLPERLRNVKIIEIKVSEFVSGDMLLGMLEAKLEQFIRDVENSPNLIIFIDEIHALVSAGSVRAEVKDILKPLLARGKARIIGATTNEEITFLEQDGAFNRRFRRIDVPEPKGPELLAMVTAATQRYANIHQARYTLDAVKSAIACTKDMPGFFPDKALSLLDQAGAATNVAHPNDPNARVVTPEMVLQITRTSTSSRTNLSLYT